jgi:hypothetical protein
VLKAGNFRCHTIVARDDTRDVRAKARHLRRHRDQHLAVIEVDGLAADAPRREHPQRGMNRPAPNPIPGTNVLAATKTRLSVNATARTEKLSGTSMAHATFLLSVPVMVPMIVP